MGKNMDKGAPLLFDLAAFFGTIYDGTEIMGQFWCFCSTISFCSGFWAVQWVNSSGCVLCQRDLLGDKWNKLYFTIPNIVKCEKSSLILSHNFRAYARQKCLKKCFRIWYIFGIKTPKYFFSLNVVICFAIFHSVLYEQITVY